MKLSEALRLRAMIEKASALLPDADATGVPELFPAWKTDIDYTVGDRRRYNSVLWKCIQNHHSQDDWTPDVAVSLWARTSAEKWPEWIQPTGASDAYMAGDKVSHNGKHWISTANNNVWEPGIYGWDEAT